MMEISNQATTPDLRGVTYTDLTISDTGNAERFVEQHGADLKHVPELAQWLVWKDSYWQVDSVGNVMERAKKTSKALFRAAAEAESDTARVALSKHAMQSLNRSRLKAMIGLAATERAVVVSLHDLDADDYLLGVQNGVVDLRDGMFRPSRREKSQRSAILTQSPMMILSVTSFTNTYMRPLAGGQTSVSGRLLIGHPRVIKS